jgi:hypothetical protein
MNSYATYCRIFQDDGYFDPTHEKLCNWIQMHVERCEEQLRVKGICSGKISLTMPRGSLKSTIVTKHFSCWIVLRRFYKFNDDSMRVLLAGNTYTNSKKKLQGIRGMYDTVELFKALFSETLPRKGREGNKWSDESACINRKTSFDESTYEVGSLNTRLTGRHYNIIIEDDTTAPDSSEMEDGMTRPSTETIESAIGFHQASTPLLVPKGFRFNLVVSTRWAMVDLISYVNEKEHFYSFDVPAELDGVPLFECFYDRETLELIRARVGDYMYSCLYLNKPIDDSLRVFRSTDMNWVDRSALPALGSITIAVDPAISEKEESCESAITVNMHQLRPNGERHQYWMEDMHGHFLPLQLAEKILNLADKYDTVDTPVRAIIVETVAYQEALKYILIDMMNKRKGVGKKTYSIVKAKRGNKGVRIESMQPAFQRKRVHFVKGALSDQTESQLLQYPMGKLVDIIDSWSMHNKVWRSERWDEPVDSPEQYKETFEQVYQEMIDMKEEQAHGSRIGIGTGEVGFNQGLVAVH